ncbi:GNAT family N-acetyltransferase [Thalassobacillus devorans]|uniref:GNAT family N-acetyltransferase n=1 Tax=Thalassobacillus devorans TaxID=279813 RepID=UPI0004BA6541|nr:GNAT family N-acetyltransferase [Thalassobacillus devorans]
MSDVKKVSASEYDTCLQLGENAFNYKLTEEQIKDRKWQMDKQDIFTVQEGDRLAAKLHLLPLQIFLNEKKIDIGGIAGVATWPEHRRKGYVGKLMKKALNVMREQGYALSLLHPFSIPFYRNYGYELTQYAYTYQGRISNLIVSQPSCEGKLVRLKKEEASSLLNDVYEKAASAYTLMLVREPWWWERRVLSDDTQIIAYEAQGQIEGYILAEMKKDRLVIEEFIYHTHSAFQALLQWMKNHDSMTEQVEISMLPGDLDAFHFANPRFKEIKQPYFMARIVDIENFFSLYPFSAPLADTPLNLKIVDKYAPWNDGVWQCIPNKEGMVVEQTSDEADLETDVKTLAALLLGSLTVDKAVFMEKLTGDPDNLERLSGWIPNNQPAFLDFF